MRSRALISAVMVPLLALSLAACGVSAGDGPQPVDSDIADLLKPEVTPTPAETLKQRLLTVTWVRGEKLVRAVRLGAADTRQERLDAALDVLLSGPGAREQTKGLTTLLPPDVVVRNEVKRGRAVIALELGGGIEPGGLSLAVGQVAVTALAVPRVRSVVFTVDGAPTAVPVPRTRGPGKDTARVVRASDYRSVLAR